MTTGEHCRTRSHERLMQEAEDAAILEVVVQQAYEEDKPQYTILSTTIPILPPHPPSYYPSTTTVNQQHPFHHPFRTHTPQLAPLSYNPPHPTNAESTRHIHSCNNDLHMLNLHIELPSFTTWLLE